MAEAGKKKHHKAQYKPKALAYKSKAHLQPGMAGIIVTCPRGRESQGVRELYDLLAEYVGEDEPGAGDDDEDDEDEEDDGATASVEDAIAKELQTLKEEKPKAKRKIVSIPMHADCLMVMRTGEGIDPVEVVARIMHDVDATKRLKTRFCQRFTPITKFCKAHMDDIEKCALEVIAPHFHGDNVPARSFMVQFNARNSNTLNRDEVIKKVAELPGGQHKVSLTDPELTIIVELYANICGLSVVKDFFKYRKFNIQMIVDPNAGNTAGKKRTTDEHGAGSKKKKTSEPVEETAEPSSS